MQPAVRSRLPFFVLGLALAVLAFAGGLAPGAARAQSTTHYTVKSGDTLDAIAAILGVPATSLPTWLAAVVQINSLAGPDALVAGADLQLPPADATPSSTAFVATTTPAAPSTSAYIVQSGDTLAAIGALAGVSSDALTSWLASVVKLNHLDSADVLAPGLSLQLPAAGSITSSSSVAAVTTKAYTVQSGDTLAAIGALAGVSSDALASWLASVVKLNHLDSADVLAPGQSLQLPTAGSVASTTSATAATLPYTVQGGDTLGGIAVKLAVADDQIGAWVAGVVQVNALADADSLVVGNLLQLPLNHGATANASAAPAASTDNGAATPGAGATASYTVANGDTLSTIADHFAVDATHLTKWLSNVLTANSLPDADHIVVGQKLVVPAPPTATALPPPIAPGVGQLANATAVSDSTSKLGASCFYNVLSGDTWSTIAAKQGVSPEKLDVWSTSVARLNGIDVKALPIGDALRFPC